MINLNFLAYIQFLITIVLLYFVLNSYKFQKSRLVIIYSMMTFGAAIFSLGYGFELLSKSYPSALMSIKFQYIGLAFLPIFWFVFAYKFYYDKYPGLIIIVIVSLIPVFTFLLIIHNEHHYLYYKSFSLVKYGKHFLVVTEKNKLYYLFISFTYLVTLYGIYSFYSVWKRNSGESKFQAKLMLIGTIWSPLSNLFYIFKITPINYDPTSLGILLMSYFFYKAIIEYDYIDLREVFRNYIFDRINEGIIVIDKNNKIIDINTTTTFLFPYLDTTSIGVLIEKYEIGKSIIQYKNKDTFEISANFEEKTFYFKLIKNDIVYNNKNFGCIYIIQDITNQHELINNLSYIATHDYLTGINNRMSFIQLAQTELNRIERYKGSISLLMIDIDFFKKVNDKFGHTAGDEVLKILSKTIKNRLRNSDIFARYGGEEFTVMLLNTSLEDSLKIAEELRSLVEKLDIKIGELIIKITISIGVFYYEPKECTLNLTQIINFSDSALYEAKNKGRNQVINHIYCTAKN